jgi:hypothetical protein
VSSPNESQWAGVAGFALSPVAGFLAGWLFARTECIGTLCFEGQFNEDAAGSATIVGVVLTGLVMLTNGEDNAITWMVGALALGASIAYLTS